MSEPQDIEFTHSISNFSAPSFSSHDPTLWFTILEVNFRAHRITSSLKEFSVATTLLPPEVSINSLILSQLPAPKSPRRHKYGSRDSNHTSNNSTNSNTNFNSMCYYHHRFGKTAHHCQHSIRETTTAVTSGP
ncbi:hypothetical protein Pmani_004515 [Petrolisthes manimaculis]|uniref:DUF7041 domain-containing protein n=1 Tax=Petrolisthes manimaculis TaxID=1843537 RepID=A0AAE1QER4_9EUCA|nr:hypothetical protein Pmani_004515 [Petrolisthes manimaculis]